MALGLHCGVSSQSVSEEVSHADGCSRRNSCLVIVHIAPMGRIPCAPARILRHRNIAHKSYPSLLPLLILKYKHHIKERLIATSIDGEKPANATVTRTHIQVLANSLSGTILMVLHFYLTQGRYCFSAIPSLHKSPTSFLSDLLVYGIIGYTSDSSKLIYQTLRGSNSRYMVF